MGVLVDKVAILESTRHNLSTICELLFPHTTFFKVLNEYFPYYLRQNVSKWL
jgi:hypothetical protein